ncbi:glycosyltransferase family 2 protein [Pectobacterium sp. A5351]|uniref:glycosyltransferase family 2 protein n=1 Tax=Pectobacterium sp. A5351 TaxID=2914983 RepID=UPI00232E8AF0|nr:glycosyltransferase [Pectobacterium sp. A5351]WCG81452.1 glycosyltransferase family 2 protein [Pectobacterium sp. A5351]
MEMIGIPAHRPMNTDITRRQTLSAIRQGCRDNLVIDGDLPSTQADILVCLTLYNEPASMLADTLAGLIRNQQQLAATFTHCPPKVMICMMLDGTDSAHPSTVSLLEKLDLTPRSAATPVHGQNSLTLQVSNLPASQILHCCDQPSTGEYPDQSISLLLANKQHNAGKLDSHAWFFWGVGSVIKTEFVLQIDTGSVTESACLMHLLQHMWQEPHCAAVATRIMLPTPTNYNPVQNWQYADFIWEKVSDWAMGNALHYLEVVPGQCSMIRWHQFCENHGHPQAPVDIYLRGLVPNTLLEHNIFLAEDRVMGLELVRHHHGSAVRYEQDAVVRTDTVPTLAELLRQRRRWINSTTAARLHSLSQLPAVLRQPMLSPLRRGKIALAVLWGFLQLITQFIMPALTAILLATGVTHLVNMLQPTTPSSYITTVGLGLALLFLSLWGGILLINRTLPLNVKTSVSYHCVAMSLLGGVMGCTFLLAFVSMTVQNLLIMGATLLLICISISLHSFGYLRQFMRWGCFYLVLLPIFNLYLATYAIANTNDVSWGTKGLTTHQVGETTRKRWSKSRDMLLAIWIVSSLAIALLFLLKISPAQWLPISHYIAAFFFLRTMLSASVSIGSSITKHRRIQRKKIKASIAY